MVTSADNATFDGINIYANNQQVLGVQFGGANGELAAAMQYSIQGLNCDDAERKDLLMDIGTEELSHLEIVGTLARLHLKPMKSVREEAEADPLIAIAGGGGVNLHNSMGNAWTADYLKITGELDVDLRSNIAAEARAKIVYERLLNFTTDAGSKDAVDQLVELAQEHEDFDELRRLAASGNQDAADILAELADESDETK